MGGGQRRAIALIVAQQCLFTVDTAAIHQLGATVSLWQIGLLRSAGGLGLVACLAPSVGWAVFRSGLPRIQAARAGATVAYGWVLIWSFAVMPFADATAISYTSAIYIALLAPLILREHVGGWRWLAVSVGGLGALLIVKPGFSQASPVYLAVTVLTSLNGLAVVLNRYLQQRGDSAITVLLYVHLAMLVTFLPGLAAHWQLTLWPWLVAACVAGPLGMYAGIVAVRYAETAALAPFIYVRLVMALAGAWLVFAEMPDMGAICGAASIVIACIIADKGDRSVGESRKWRPLPAPADLC